MLKVPNYHFTVEETISFLEKEGHKLSLIITDKSELTILSQKRINCLIYKSDILKNGSNEILKVLSPLNLDGYIMMDQELDSEELCEQLQGIGYRVCRLDLKEI